MNELKQEEKDQQAAIERLRDASRQGPFSAEEARAAGETAQDIAERQPSIEREAINRAVAAFGGRAGERGGGAFDIEQLERIAQLMQMGALELPSDVSARGAKAITERALERHAERLDEIFAREADQRRESLQEAGKQTTSSGGPTIDLEDFIQKNAPAGTDVGRMVELWKLLKEHERPEGGDKILIPREDRYRLEMLMSKFEQERGRDTGEVEASRLNREAAELNKQAAEANRDAAERAPVVHYHNQHSRNVYPDARATRAATINGESDKERRKMG